MGSKKNSANVWLDTMPAIQRFKWVVLIGAVMLSYPASLDAASECSLLTSRDRVGIEAALGHLCMTERDFQFHKDVADACDSLWTMREILHDPVVLTETAAYVERALSSTNGEDLLMTAARLLEFTPLERAPVVRGTPVAALQDYAECPAELRVALAAFLQTAQAVKVQANAACSALTTTDRHYLAAAEWGSVFRVEDVPTVREKLLGAGLSGAAIDTSIRESYALDPEPSARKRIDLSNRVQMRDLLQASVWYWQALQDLADRLSAFDEWPASPLVLDTEAGRVVIGTTGADTYRDSALLILDPGGDDLYTARAGVASSLIDTPVAAIIDLDGNDRYQSEELLAAGSAFMGIAMVLDVRGHDSYTSSYAGSASSFWGVSMLVDSEGDDVYRARALSQGYAFYGVGLLLDVAGRDLYDVGFLGQGCAGYRGVGALLDHHGNDSYSAGGVEPDFHRGPGRFLSLAQGFSIGMRPFAGGGYGVLLDREGCDSYRADIYGQGAGYWYAAGMLLDQKGNDHYHVHQYGQGAGIHLSGGLLADGGGDDVYSGYSLAQGAAHDYAVGMLLEGGGNDTYTADHHAQGRAMNNALALLIDRGGRDTYFARRHDQCQGMGNDGGEREYGSLAMLLDLDGLDYYSGGASNASRRLNPDYGIVLDASMATGLLYNSTLFSDRNKPVIPPAVSLDVQKDERPATQPAATVSFQSAAYDRALMDELMFHASRYPSTPEKRRKKDESKEKLYAHESRALAYLVDQTSLDNLWMHVFAFELNRLLEAEDCVPVLLKALQSPRSRVRKTALYFLGFHETPEHAERVRPFLSDIKCAGAALRTLGKWQYTNAVEEVLRFADDDDERRRVLAVNALGSIGAPSCVEPLIQKLEDPFFTVRERARWALQQYGTAIERDLLRHLPESGGIKRCHLVRLLAECGTERSLTPLQDLLTSENDDLKRDIQTALSMIRDRRGGD